MDFLLVLIELFC